MYSNFNETKVDRSTHIFNVFNAFYHALMYEFAVKEPVTELQSYSFIISSIDWVDILFMPANIYLMFGKKAQKPATKKK